MEVSWERAQPEKNRRGGRNKSLPELLPQGGGAIASGRRGVRRLYANSKSTSSGKTSSKEEVIKRAGTLQCGLTELMWEQK